MVVTVALLLCVWKLIILQSASAHVVGCCFFLEKDGEDSRSEKLFVLPPEVGLHAKDCLK